MKQRAFLFLVFLATGCASKIDQKADPQVLLQQICSIGESVQVAEGSVWIKGKSPDLSGQAPALVRAQSPDQLDLEVTNLLGGTEARVTVRGSQYQVVLPSRSQPVQSGRDQWGGIPLRWSTRLFLGQIPCPKKADFAKLRFQWRAEESLLIAESAQEVFEFFIKNESGQAWPESLVWRQSAPQRSVRWNFAQPESKTRSPLKWDGTSDRGDQIRLIWKERRTSLTESK